MKNKRRLTAMLLAGCLAVSSVPVALAEDAPERQEQVADQAREDSKAAAPTEGTCGEDVSWKLENGTLTISGTGAMKDYTYDDLAPWNGSEKDIKTAVIESGVTSIGSSAFSGCSNMTQVSLTDSLKNI